MSRLFLIASPSPLLIWQNSKMLYYDSPVRQVNHLMPCNQTFSCFVVDRVKYRGVDLPGGQMII